MARKSNESTQKSRDRSRKTGKAPAGASFAKRPASKATGNKPRQKTRSQRALKPTQKTASGARPSTVRPGTKLAAMIDLIRRKDGATIEEIQNATGWQAHSVRGAMSGALKKKLGLTVDSAKVAGRGRVYRIVSTR